MGKWSGLKGRFPEFEESVQDKKKLEIEKHHGKLNEMTTGTLANLWIGMYGGQKNVERMLEDVKQDRIIVEQALLKAMEEDGTTSLKTDSGFTVTASPEPYPTVTDQPLFLEWIKGVGLESTLTLNHQRMAAMVKEMLEDNKPLPPGVTVFMKERILHRSSR